MNCKDSKDSYNYWGLQNCRWMTNGDGAKDCYDCYSTGGPELCYNSVTPDHSYAAFFTVYCWKSQYILYSENCHSSNHLFGCVGMKQGKYSILNREYSPEEYEALLKKIVTEMKASQEWGEFFRPDLTLFAYNETPAHQFYPLSLEQAEAQNYPYQQKLPGAFSKETVRWTEVPDSISLIGSSGSFGEGKTVPKEIFPCILCAKNFKILEKEFSFYKNKNVPLPRFCIDCRYNKRFALMNPRKLYAQNCQNCETPFQTTYAPDRPEKIYCEECYLKEVY